MWGGYFPESAPGRESPAVSSSLCIFFKKKFKQNDLLSVIIEREECGVRNHGWYGMPQYAKIGRVRMASFRGIVFYIVDYNEIMRDGSRWCRGCLIRKAGVRCLFGSLQKAYGGAGGLTFPARVERFQNNYTEVWGILRLDIL
jgi:hypothetical protein